MQSAVIPTAIPSVRPSLRLSHADTLSRQMNIGRKSGCGPGLGELPEIWGFPFNISATAKAIDFKFGTQVGFAKAHHKITPRGKSGHGLGLGELPKILGFPYNISATAGASDFKFGMQLGFAKAMIKSHAEERVGIALG